MIVRLSVKDNDFSIILESYLSNFLLNITKTCELTRENALDIWENQKKINQILNPNIHRDWTEEDTEFLEEQIRQSFAYFCEKRKPASKEYLVKNLDIKFLKSVADKWENGEACYWFQHSKIVLTQ